MKRVNKQQNGYRETYDCIFEQFTLLDFRNNVIVRDKLDPKDEG